MKNLGRLKLNQLSKANLKKRELISLKGGFLCSCACCYEGQPGGSSTGDNAVANSDNGLYSRNC
ncbi:MAG: TIGR04149 family rSAM-modified RiPP [Bacteroidota bacterium]